MPDPEQTETLFPALCHFKVIALDQELIQGELNEVLIATGFPQHSFQAGNRSANGKYITFETSIEIETRESMETIDAQLRQVRGVKMIL